MSPLLVGEPAGGEVGEQSIEAVEPILRHFSYIMNRLFSSSCYEEELDQLG